MCLFCTKKFHKNLHKGLDYNSQYGNLTEVKYLTKHNKFLQTELDSAFLFAARHGHLKILCHLISVGANPHSEVPFQEAANHFKLNVVKYLYEKSPELQEKFHVSIHNVNKKLKLNKIDLRVGMSLKGFDNFKIFVTRKNLAPIDEAMYGAITETLVFH